MHIDNFIRRFTKKVRNKKVRKNITISKESDEKLKELAKLENKSQSKLIEELIEDVYKELEKKKSYRL